MALINFFNLLRLELDDESSSESHVTHCMSLCVCVFVSLELSVCVSMLWRKTAWAVSIKLCWHIVHDNKKTQRASLTLTLKDRRSRVQGYQVQADVTTHCLGLLFVVMIIQTLSLTYHWVKNSAVAFGTADRWQLRTESYLVMYQLVMVQ